MKFQFNHRKKIIIFLLALVVILTGAFFAYRKYSGRTATPINLKGENASSGTDSNGNISGTENAAGNPIASENASQGNAADSQNADGDEEGASSLNQNLDPNQIGNGSANMFAHITTEHCDSACRAFANNLQYFEYCEQVCGISPARKASNCDEKKDLEKDYCLKDLGITKKDNSICNQIEDANLKKTCKNRILQDIIEGQ